MFCLVINFLMSHEFIILHIVFRLHVISFWKVLSCSNNSCTVFMSQIVDEIMAMSIPMTEDEISDKAEKIKNAVDQLTNIDQILKETADNRAIADQLKKDAEAAS